jgi:c-di-GMP-binding flagellar brake protein YcgR
VHGGAFSLDGGRGNGFNWAATLDVARGRSSSRLVFRASPIMENRRQTYRLPLSPHETLDVRLHLPGQQGMFACELLDLSLGGMCVCVPVPTGTLHVGDTLTARLLGRDAPEPVELSLELPASVVYLKRYSNGQLCGIHFLPFVNPSMREQIERTLSRFILAEQRRKRRAGG